jgi:electron transport complex protein RnfC
MAQTRHLWRFHGGLHLPSRKQLATELPLETVPLPAQLVLPVEQHVGAPGEPLVAIGDRVLRGQPLTRIAGYIGAAVHAPSSGTVVAIEPRPVAHPSGLDATAIVIDTDGEDEPWTGIDPFYNYQTLNPAALRRRVRDCGLVGLGGAVFPTAVKLNVGAGLRTLILNGAECEPYICCDDMLMRTRPRQVVAGAQIMLHALDIRHCIIAIETDKPEACAALTEALREAQDPRIELIQVPAIYPEGGERQLIQVLTGEEVPSDGIPPDIGYLCHNVGTAAAVARAVLDGEPLISRIVTVTGSGVARPRNVEARFGTPVADLVRHCGGYTEGARHLLMGGAMMGLPLASDTVPVVKATNCLLVATADDIRPRAPAMPCIRCGDCATACPASLLPQQLYWHARSDQLDKARELYLFDCIECGICDTVCPSQIPLTEYFRYAKSEIWARQRERQQSDLARRRFESREARLAREKAERRQRLARKARTRDTSAAAEKARKAVIAEVMERVRRGKSQADSERDQS